MAVQHIKQHDPILAAIIDQVGPCTLRPHNRYYQELVESIIGQQLSLKAAAAIESRFVALFEGIFPTPHQILAQDSETLRSVGFSRAKVVYIKDLAEHLQDGRIQLEKFTELSNQEIMEELLPIKGIGEWTVHMYLIFCLGRLDVLPTGDLGIRNGVRQLYNFESPPTPKDIQTTASSNQWHPYESVASWYVWRSLELT